MGYDLISLKDDSRFCVNMSGLRPLLELAEQFGWEPEGTDPSKYLSLSKREEIKSNDFDYDGGYFTNDGQVVTSTDANKIADALEKALKEIPNDGEICEEMMYLLSKGQSNEFKKSHVEAFIKFCRIGAFTIE